MTTPGSVRSLLVSSMAPATRTRKPEVEQLHAVLRQEDVRRLQIAMDDPLLVQRPERAEHRERDLPGLPRRQRAACQTCAQRLAVEQLHREEQVVAVRVDFVELADVRVTDARGGTRLAPQPLPFLSIAAVRAQALDGDGAVETLVVRGIDHAHAAFAKLTDDAIPAGFHAELSR